MLRSRAALFGFGFLLWAGDTLAQPPESITTVAEKANYSAGYRFGTQLLQMKQSGEELDLQAVLKGVMDALYQLDTAMSAEEMAASLKALERNSGAGAGQQAATATARRPPARERGFKDDYARLNAQRPGVTVLPSGVQYEELRAGGGPRPKDSDTVVVSYQGTLTNGVVFDSTQEDSGPAHLKVRDIAVPGLKEALLLMPTGAKWRVVIPPNMGFAKSGNNLLRRRDLIYEIQLISIEPGS